MDYDLSEIEEQVASLKDAFQEIQQPRTDYEIEHFVVRQHDTEPRQWAQCVLELQIKHQNIRRAMLNAKKIKIEIDDLIEKGDPKSMIKAELKKIDLEDQDYAMLGAIREFRALYCIFKSFKKQYTREELNASEVEYWDKRLTRQANLDMLAQGRVGQGNADALRMIGKAPIPELDHTREIEKRYLETVKQRLLIAVPTEHKAEQGLPCLENLRIPETWERKIYNCFGRPVAEAYNDIIQTALKDGATHLLTVEDDTFPPSDAFMKLLAHDLDAVGAWYPKKVDPREGAPIVLRNGKREFLEDDGEVHEVLTLPMGCTLYKVEIFKQIQFPFCVTTNMITQDSYLSQQLREAGIKLHVDTSIRCEHRDRKTGRVYK